MDKYCWRRGAGFFKADANKVATEIMAIGDDVKPSDVVEKARDKSTELHKCFTWDNKVAGEKWRLYEARQVMCQLVIVEEESPTDRPEIRVFHKTLDDEGYKPIEIVVQNKDEYAKLLERAWAELRAFKAKYAMLKELEEILNLID